MKCQPSFIAVVVLGLAVTPAPAQRSSYDPGARQPSRQRDSFVDFVLKRVNPDNQDYGQRIDEYRRIASEATVRDVNFWMAMAATGGVVVLFLMLWHEGRMRTRQEIMVAGFLASYHNAWAEARAESRRVIAQYGLVAQKLNAATEGALKASTPAGSSTTTAKPTSTVPDEQRSQSGPSDAGKGDLEKHSGNSNSNVADQRTRDSRKPKADKDADLVAQINALQQQLSAAHEREKNLQKELGRTQRRSGTDQQRDLNFVEPAGTAAQEDVIHVRPNSK